MSKTLIEIETELKNQQWEEFQKEINTINNLFNFIKQEFKINKISLTDVTWDSFTSIHYNTDNHSEIVIETTINRVIPLECKFKLFFKSGDEMISLNVYKWFPEENAQFYFFGHSLKEVIRFIKATN